MITCSDLLQIGNLVVGFFKLIVSIIALIIQANKKK